MLIRCDGLVIRENEKHIVTRKVFRIESVEGFRVREVDSPGPERHSDHAKARNGIMVVLVDTAEKEDFEASSPCRRNARRSCAGTEQGNHDQHRGEDEGNGKRQMTRHGNSMVHYECGARPPAKYLFIFGNLPSGPRLEGGV